MSDEHQAQDGAYYCPGCGTRYDTPGICTGPLDSGHEPLNVVSVDETEATMDAAKVNQPDVPVEEPAAPVAAVDTAAYDELAGRVTALESRVGSLESSHATLSSSLSSLANTTVPGLAGRVTALESKPAAPDAPAEAPAAPAPTTGFTPAEPAQQTEPPGGWPAG